MTINPPGQPRLRRRVDTHASALARMRVDLADPRHDLAVRAVAAQGTDEVAMALLDGWAVVADVVAFYSERIATEGFLRTATELRSVRELARTLGYELRPGVAAQADLAFTVETAVGAPEVVTIAAGTPVQSVPGPGQLPQTFETAQELEARTAWNAVAAVDTVQQSLSRGQLLVWLRAAAGTVRPGDSLLIRGSRVGFTGEQRQVRRAQAVATAPDGLLGWLRVELDEGIAVNGPGLPAVLDDVHVYSFADRAQLFGWNAPDPNLLVVDGQPPTGAAEDDAGDPVGPPYAWAGFEVTSPLELAGEHPGVLRDSWLAVRQGDKVDVFDVGDVLQDGAAKWTLSGLVTMASVVPDTGLAGFDRHRAIVLCAPAELAAAERPDTGATGGRTLTVVATDPPLPPDRRVLLRGAASHTGRPAVAVATVLACTVAEDGATMDLELAADMTAFARQGLEVLANVAVASHGETVQQVLGSGDGLAAYATYRPRRPPLTYLRDATPDGARAELTVRVDGVAWSEVPSLDLAGPDDRVYAVHHDERGAVRIVTGDGVHGARPPSGQENVTGTYRSGIGADGAVDAGHLTLLPRRPFGVRAVTNPAPAQDWAPPEATEEARSNAPLRVRTLDRAVSVTDYEDLARGYAGIGPGSADLVWDGRDHRVLVTVMATGATLPSDDLVTALRATLEAVRDPSRPLDVLAGEQIWFGLRVEVAHDAAYERPVVLAAVNAALHATWSASARPFAAPVTSSGVLVAIREVPGVTACTMPRLLSVVDPPPPPLLPVLPPDRTARDVLGALPARWDGGPRSAQLLALAPGAVELGEMP